MTDLHSELDVMTSEPIANRWKRLLGLISASSKTSQQNCLSLARRLHFGGPRRGEVQPSVQYAQTHDETDAGTACSPIPRTAPRPQNAALAECLGCGERADLRGRGFCGDCDDERWVGQFPGLR